MNWYKTANDNEGVSWAQIVEETLGSVSDLNDEAPQYKAVKEFGKKMELIRAKAKAEALNIINRYEGNDAILPIFAKVFERGTLRVPGINKENTRKVMSIIQTTVMRLRRKYRGECRYLFPFIAEIIKEYLQPDETNA